MEFLIKMSTEKCYKQKNWFLKDEAYLYARLSIEGKIYSKTITVSSILADPWNILKTSATESALFDDETLGFPSLAHRIPETFHSSPYHNWTDKTPIDHETQLSFAFVDNPLILKTVGFGRKTCIIVLFSFVCYALLELRHPRKF